MIQTRRPASFARNLLALSLSDAAGRISRLAVVVVVARALDAQAIGVAAAALAASDILKSLTENGVGQRIISAPEAQLEATCATARRIFRGWCLGLFALQIGIGAAIWIARDDAMTFAMIAVLAGEYLFMPAGLVQCALAMREGKLRQTSAIAAAQVVGANLMTAALARVLAGPMALILPRLMAAPIWTLAMRRLRPWAPRPGVTGLPLRHFAGYGAAILGVEVVKALRLQADKLVIGLLLGPEALGLYFMAFNAGLGIATSFSTAFSVALFPWLCAAADRAAALRRAVQLAVGLLAPVVGLQALAAPHYVTLLFGAKWAASAPVVATLCLAAIPAIVWSAAAQWLRAHDRPGVEFTVTLAMTAALIANTALMAPYGLLAVAKGYLAVATLTQLVASLPALAAAFGLRPLRLPFVATPAR